MPDNDYTQTVINSLVEVGLQYSDTLNTDCYILYETVTYVTIVGRLFERPV